MKRLLAAVLILFCLAGAMPAAAKPPAPFLPWWYQAPPTIPTWYYQNRCYIAYWYLTQRTGVDPIGSPVTGQSYEPQWVCH